MSTHDEYEELKKEIERLKTINEEYRDTINELNMEVRILRLKYDYVVKKTMPECNIICPMPVTATCTDNGPEYIPNDASEDESEDVMLKPVNVIRADPSKMFKH